MPVPRITRSENQLIYFLDFTPQHNITAEESLRAYTVDAERSSKGPQVVLSRTHPGLLIKPYEQEVPEWTPGGRR